MATFPESNPTPNYPFNLIPRWGTSKVELSGDVGVVQKRSSIVFPIFDVIVTYTHLTLENAQTIVKFFNARRGGYEPFYIYDMASAIGDTLDWESLYCGIGNGSITTFDIPGRSTSDQTVYVSGVQQTLVTDYTISSGTGTSGADQIVFEAGSIPEAGQNVSVDFTGHLRCRVCFDSDEMSRETFIMRFTRYGQIKLIGQEPFA